MRLISLLAIGVLACGASLAFDAQPASALTAAEQSSERRVVTGEPWSGPAKPVRCDADPAATVVTCVPDDASDTGEFACFSGVSTATGEAAVCTSYVANHAEITAAYGTRLKLEYDCALGDILCTTSEQLSRTGAEIVAGGLAWVLSNVTFDTSSYLWDAATGEWSWWWGTTVLVLFGAGLVGVAVALFGRDRAEVLSALLRLALAVPASTLSVWMIGQLANVIDEFAQGLVTRPGGGERDGLFRTVLNLVYSPGNGNFIFAVVIIGLLVVGVAVIVCIFSFRNLALAALIALAPVAWMLFPMQVGRAWVVRWASMVVTLLLTTPLTLGMLMLVLGALGGVETLWSIQALPAAMGMIMIGITPFAIYALTNVAGGEIATGAGDHALSGAGRSARQRVVSTAARVVSRSPNGRRWAGAASVATAPARSVPTTGRIPQRKPSPAPPSGRSNGAGGQS